MVLTAMLKMPCENAGIAVGIGLDDLFARYEPSFRPDDVVYMPMELQQYSTTASAYRVAVDGQFLLRHDRGVLINLPLPRVVGAVFCCTLPDLMEALVEMPVAVEGAIKPANLLDIEYNEQGDRIDNDLSNRNAALLASDPRIAPSARNIKSGYGTALIGAFVARESGKGVIIIGGMPVGYSSAQIPDGIVSAIAATYDTNGGRFMVLPNLSGYPRADFFNGEDHLAKPYQYPHSIFIAERLGELLRKPIASPPSSALRLAADCPSVAGSIVAN
jgi:hypothetical protein